MTPKRGGGRVGTRFDFGGGDPNLYGYVLGNPVDGSDPGGLDANACVPEQNYTPLYSSDYDNFSCPDESTALPLPETCEDDPDTRPRPLRVACQFQCLDLLPCNLSIIGCWAQCYQPWGPHPAHRPGCSDSCYQQCNKNHGGYACKIATCAN